MDEQTLKVLARLTEVGQWWPVGAWIYFDKKIFQTIDRWYQIKDVDGNIFQNMRVRYESEISELEANAKGIFRGRSDV
jgi:hypothetical protein